jgi:hypothetical protein
MTDLIGYAVAWKSKTDGVVHLTGQARLRYEAEVLLAAERLKFPNMQHMLIEIYPDSTALSVNTKTAVVSGYTDCGRSAGSPYEGQD